MILHSRRYGWYAFFLRKRDFINNTIQDGDETIVYDSAQALLTFQKLYGPFPRIIGKGDCAGVGLVY